MLFPKEYVIISQIIIKFAAKNHITRMKRRLFIVLSLLMPALLLAGNISEKQAADIATRFLTGKGRIAAIRGHQQSITTTLLTPVGSNKLFHIFNVGQSDGYVIVSGDDRTEAILGYAEEGRLVADSLPLNMQSWLASYAEQIEWLQQSEVANARRNLPVYSYIAPLTETKWDQGAPYSNNCPTYNGMRCATGCVATAMAQVMYYHQWPSRTKQTIPGYTTDTYNLNVSTKSTTSIDWGSMQTTYSTSETGSGAAAVAKLMELTGASVGMDYTPNNSGAYSSKVAKALYDYFDYDGSVQYKQRVFHNTSTWEKLVYQELAASRPVYYGGVSAGGGHAFVVDGYDNGYFHVNWGWTGKHNGFFLLSVLDPKDYSGSGAGSGGNGYSIEQTAVIGIQPSQGTPYTEYPMTVRDIKIVGDKQINRSYNNSNFSNIQIKSSVYNEGSPPHTFEMGYGVFDKSGKQVHVHKEGSNTMALNVGSYVSSTLSFGAGWADGTYTIKAVHRVMGENTWKTNLGGDTRYINAVVSGRTLTLSEPTLNLHGSVSTSGNLRKGRTITLSIDVDNNGPDYSGMVYVFLESTMIGGQTIDLSNGESCSFEISHTLPEAGTKTIKLTTDMEGNEEIGSTTISIEEAPKTNLGISMTSPSVDSNKHIRSDKLLVNIKMTNKLSTTYDDYINVTLFKLAGSSGMASLSQQEKKDVVIQGGESATCSVEFADIEAGEQYLILVYYINEGEQKVGFQSEVLTAVEPERINFVVTDVSTQDEFREGGTGHLYVDVRNDGNVSEGKLYVFMDNVLETTIDIYSHQPGATKTYTLSITPQRQGRVEIMVTADEERNEVLKTYTIEVAAPKAIFAISRIEQVTETALAGQPVSVNIFVRNDGEIENGKLYLFLNDEPLEGLDLHIPPRNTDSYTISFTPEESGMHTLKVCATEELNEDEVLDWLVINVTEPMVVITEATISQITPKLLKGKPAEFAIRFTNEGNTKGGTLYVFIDGQTEPVVVVNETVPPGETCETTFLFDPPEAGEQLLKVTTDKAGTEVIGQLTIHVEEPEIKVAEVTITQISQQLLIGEPAEFSVSFTNEGNIAGGSFFVFLSGQQEPVATVQETVNPGETCETRISFLPQVAGEHLLLKVTTDEAGLEVVGHMYIDISEKERRFSVHNIRFDDQEVSPGTNVYVKFSVNREGYFIDGTLYLFVDDERVGFMNINTDVWTEYMYFFEASNTVGEHTFSIAADAEGKNVLGSGTFTVKYLPANFVVNSIESLTDTLRADNPVGMTVMVKNEGDIAGETRLYFFLNYDCVDSLQVTLDAGVEQAYTINFVPVMTGWQRLFVTTDADHVGDEVYSMLLFIEENTAGIMALSANDDESVRYDVYTTGGHLVATGLTAPQWEKQQKQLPPGIYLLHSAKGTRFKAAAISRPSASH